MTWRCPQCERVHETNDPPCSSCGHESFVRAAAPTAGEPDSTVDSLVWACPECDREHVKNSPPCSRCGHPLLERCERTFEDVDDLPAGSYVSAIQPYAPLLVLFALVVGLAASGVVTPAMIPGHGPPSAPDAPGESETAAGIDLEEVEQEVHERLETIREDRGVESVSYDSSLAHLATYLNQDRVRVKHGRESVGDPDAEDFHLSCSRTINAYPIEFGTARTIDAYENESAVADALTQRLVVLAEVENVVISSAFSSEGMDVHVGPDGEIYALYAIC